MACKSEKGKIAIIGSGLIGQSWAAIFVGAGYNVTVYDIDDKQIEKALANMTKSLKSYETQGCLRGNLSAEEQSKLITGSHDIKACMENAIYVQECVPESIEMKKSVFGELDKYCTKDMVIASSSSCINSSQFTENLNHKTNMLIAHPVNPPYFLPLVEIIPAPWTATEITNRTRQLMEEIGQAPITLKKEVPGFALNRIQYAVINECWSLYKNGVLSAEDIDKVMYEGLGRRYAFIGPLETMHLNADGIKDYCKKYAEGMQKVSSTFTPPPIEYDAATADNIQEELTNIVPADQTQTRKEWRDERLAQLDKLKRNK
ncbi:hypothetical protein LOTGIDRAFT_189928 [Lottia gigantea]|uniref:3-hydroxyacyl-CoA dehydrogenase NAD binding domain-containing protein n=1 Tax=Lottia gigantea TaxID=225164 RepID=V4A956_LOTGI|nr:hypothetical protein LOTGIDRAFT_189928 [Lottia gigantea]ESO93302.1 hypothetical protein LOTGIDRAFT_189928 [Lottia gigantea]